MNLLKASILSALTGVVILQMGKKMRLPKRVAGGLAAGLGHYVAGTWLDRRVSIERGRG